MMRPVGDVKVYLHREPIDMRRGRNGLAALVREAMQQDPFDPGRCTCSLDVAMTC
jgi:transposase